MKIKLLGFIIINICFLAFSCSQKLHEAMVESKNVSWFDDYYTIEYIDSSTIAIGEPRYHQHNYNYLILGKNKAILFDTGPGVRNIKTVVDSLTDLPVVVTQSHFHYDHIGNHKEFDDAYLADVQQLKDREKNGYVKIKTKEHLGFVENIKKTKFKVDGWWEIGDTINLGDRELILYHIPGHTPESVALYDPESKYLFSGDFLCPGPNLAAVPGSDITEYLSSTENLLNTISKQTKLLTAHRDTNSVKFGAPILDYNDLVDLKIGLRDIIDNKKKKEKGFIIKQYKINDRIQIYLTK